MPEAMLHPRAGGIAQCRRQCSTPSRRPITPAGGSAHTEGLSKQPFLLILFALHIQQAVAHFPQLPLQLRSRNIALRNDDALPGAMGRLHFFYLKILPDQVVHMALAHAALHSINMCRNLTHLFISFFYRKNKFVKQKFPDKAAGESRFICYFFEWHPPLQPCPP